jgi:flagellar hook protein FlgE
MGFQTGLSGLNAASKNLDVIGNNIANSTTVGMKSSRAEFAALVASAAGPSGGGGAGGSGIGVQVATVSQQFSQGTINITGNNLDVAINGGGFFQVKLPDGTAGYTRDGQFKLDNQGNLKTNAGANVMGFPTDLTGTPTSTSIQPLTVPTGAPIPAKITTAITAEFNLDARAKVATSVTPPPPITTYATALNGFDSQGVPVPVSLYFVKVGPDPTVNPTTPASLIDTWDVFDSSTVAAGTAALAADAAVGAINATNYALDIKNTALNLANGNSNLPTFTNFSAATGLTLPAMQALPSTSNAVVAPSTTQSGALFQIQFDANGIIIPQAAPFTLTLTSTNPNVGPLGDGKFDATLDISSATQFGTAFAVSQLTQDGYTAGTLTGVSINEQGVVTTSYSNGQNQSKGQIALADFRNVQGLKPAGGGNWTETEMSGQPIQGAPAQGNFGGLRAGALESSNVDLTAELVAMMTAQRDYQANAQTIKTQDQVLSTLVNLR